MHQNDILHRDIKSDNVLMDETTGQIKLSDFSAAKNMSRNAKAKTTVGTPYWMVRDGKMCQIKNLYFFRKKPHFFPADRPQKL